MKKERDCRNKVTYVEVDQEREGQRIDNFLLGQLKGVPKKHIYRILRRGEVRVNSKRIRPFYRILSGDSIRIPPVHVATRTTPELTDDFIPAQLESRILFEDNFIMAINKPAGIPVHGGTGQQCGLIEALRLLRTETHFLELVHRLDLDTSGCLLIAKKRSVLRILHEHFRNNYVDKCYQALLNGQVQPQLQTVQAPIRIEREGTGARKVSIAKDGKYAKTQIRCLQQGTEHTLAECKLYTGRTHQIRVHSQYIGHPIIGDQRYGHTAANKKAMAHGLNRQFLHASSLGFQHPISNELININCDLDEDLKTFLDKINL